ncbi:MAG: hypothetical protein H0X37_10175 [Herpetosiphonaceae bacterium]|nr:hypothetical protein [Herpetosiphonaceae bacterium]
MRVRYLARSLSLVAVVGLMFLATVPVHATSTRKVIVFLQGLGSYLTQAQLDTMSKCLVPVQVDPFNKLKGQLLNHGNYQCSDFLQFSYAGGSVDEQGRWQAMPYDCIASSANSLATNTNLLATMLNDYQNAHPDIQVRFELVGHSLGGLIAFDTSALAGGTISADAIDSVVTIDSLLNHKLTADLQAQRQALPGYTLPHSAPSCNSLVLAQAYNFTWSPAIIEVSDVTDDQVKQNYLDDRQAVVTAGQSYQIRYMTTGNSSDCAYDQDLCHAPGMWQDERYTMTVANADNVTMFDEGTNNCVAKLFIVPCFVNTHFAVLKDGQTAVPAIVSFIGGQVAP